MKKDQTHSSFKSVLFNLISEAILVAHLASLNSDLSYIPQSFFLSCFLAILYCTNHTKAEYANKIMLIMTLIVACHND